MHITAIVSSHKYKIENKRSSSHIHSMRIKRENHGDTSKVKGGRSRSRSPRCGYRDDYRDTDYYRVGVETDMDMTGTEKERDYRCRSRSRSYSPDDYRRCGRDSVSPARRSPSRSRSHSYSPDDYRRCGRDSVLPVCRSPSRSPRRTPSSHERSLVRCYDDQSPRS